MPKNVIQFQRGVSLSEHFSRYGTEEQCREAIFKLRWPNGFVCPACANTTHCIIKSRKVYQCNTCHTQTSLTCGTIFSSTRLPLSTWFLAIYLLTQRKKSISTLQLKHEIGVSYKTAWSIRKKIIQVMLDHQLDDRLAGRIDLSIIKAKGRGDCG